MSVVIDVINYLTERADLSAGDEPREQIDTGKRKRDSFWDYV